MRLSTSCFMNKLIISLLSILACFSTMQAASVVEQPDFGFPQTVIANADSVLRVSKSPQQRMAAVMQIATSKYLIDRDSIGVVNTMLADYSQKATEPATKALLDLFRIEMLTKAYRHNRYRYDQINAPLSPLPQNPQEWSGEQFRMVIKDLINQVLEIAHELKTIEISAFSDVITSTDNSRSFYPRLSDFVFLMANQYASYIDDETLAQHIRELALASQPVGTLQWAVWLDTNFDLLRAEFEKYSTNLIGGYLLCRLTTIYTNTQYLLDKVKNYLSTENSNIFTPALKSYYQSMTRPIVDLSCTNTIIPGKPLKVVVESQYSSRVGVALYRINNPKKLESRFSYELSELTLLDKNEFTNNLPEQKCVDSVFFDIKESGVYLVSPLIEGMSSNEVHNYIEVVATDYVPFVVRVNNLFATAVVSINDGAATKDADVTLYTPWRNDSEISIGRTNHKGIARGAIRDSSAENVFSANISVAKGSKKYFFGQNQIINYRPTDYDIDNLDAEFFLSRPIYHPGDLVEWAMVLGRYDASTFRAKVCSGIDVNIYMYDANFAKIDSVSLTTDEYGRVTGSFKIPSDRLSGFYTLQLKSTSYAHLRPQRASKKFMVSDFKPADTELSDVNVQMNVDGTCTITGRVLTMSGMGIANAKVDVQFSPVIYWWWWRYFDVNAKSVDIDVVTDDHGYFSLQVLPDALTPKCDYNVTLRAIAPSGETSNYSTTIFNSDFISIASNVELWNTDSDLPLPINAIRSDKKIDVPAEWSLIRDNDIIATGACHFDSTGVAIDLSNYPAAAYKLAFKFSADFKVVNDTIDITTYSVKRNTVPSTQRLLLPSTSVMIKPGDDNSFKLGVPEKSSVFIFYLSPTDIENVERVDLKAGFHDISLPEFKSGKQMRVVIATFDGESFINDCVAVNYENSNTLSLKVESWRDKLLPNTEETITFKLSHIDGSPVNGALIATMYNRALDKLQNIRYPQATDLFSRFNCYKNINYSLAAYMSKTYDIRYIKPEGRTVYFSVELPNFKYLNSYNRRYNLRHSASGLVAYGASNVAQVEDAIAEESANELAMSYATKEVVESEVAYKDESAINDNSDYDFREGEVLQAFFYPKMSFDLDGSATITYTVPNANGSWQFIASAWDEMAYCATDMRTAISNKPVMVQPNLPRFLREGDEADLSVAFFNNTDNEGAVTYSCEIFDPSTGEILSTQSNQITIKAGASSVKSFKALAPVGLQAIGMRCKATLGNYTDGEQNLIPILASGMTVIDSETFYLTDENPNFVSVIKAADGPADFTLQYCANPIWDVVKAIPSLYNSQPKTSIEAAYSIYSALTARGLSRKFPEINQAVNMWIANPSDSALVSNLYKNESLKIATLQQTPWMQAAASQSDRMSQLAVTFDSKEIRSTLDAAVKALQDLEQSDGGFAWGSWCKKSSFWSTLYVLESLGRLNRWGFLSGTSELDKIIEKAFDYVDANVHSEDLAYAYMMSFYPGRKPSTVGAQTALHNALQYEVENWRKASTAQKARWAVTLYNHGYTAVAKEIVASLRQFEVKNAQAGISFPSVNDVDAYATILEAFALIDPIEAELDAMRQWLVLRTQVSDDLISRDRCSLISAILTTGSRWTNLQSSKSPVSIDGNPLKVGRIDQLTGAFSTTLPLSDAGASLRVSRPSGSGVSYGSVTSLYTTTLDSVQARGSSEISISKRLLVKRDGQWVETKSVAVGELVQVQLQISTSRDMEYLTIIDARPAAFEPVEQLPGFVYTGGVAFYRENNDESTNLFIDYLPRGIYYISYEMNVNVAGSFASGPATIQSQYAPELNARSGSSRIMVKPFIAD